MITHAEHIFIHDNIYCFVSRVNGINGRCVHCVLH
jgi:hypothetical protein